MDKTKVIKDVVYGYISLNQDDVENIIDTPHFQRLKRVRHLNALSLFPSTNHTRFEHSLGVYYIAERIFDNIAQFLDFDITQRDIAKRTVKYAALLHDIGHTPFSHVFEDLYLTDSTDRIRRDLNLVFENINNQGKTGYFYEENSNDLIDKLLGEINHETASIYISLKAYCDYLKEKGIDFGLFCRMIKGIPYKTDEIGLNSLIAILSSDFDADRVDYIARDGFMTGTLKVDVDRIIQCYELDEEKRLRLNRRALSIVSSFLHGRLYLYYWVYGHRKTRYFDTLVRMMYDYAICNDNLGKLGIPENYISLENIYKELLDDCDIESKFKAIFYNHIQGRCKKKECPCCSLAEQYYYRKHLKPVWKNIWEYINIFAPVGSAVYSQQEKDRLINVNRILNGLSDRPYSNRLYDEYLCELFNEVLAKRKPAKNLDYLKTRFMVSLRDISVFHNPDRPRTYIELNGRTFLPEEVLTENIYKIDYEPMKVQLYEHADRTIRMPFVYADAVFISNKYGIPDIGEAISKYIKNKPNSE